MTERCRSGRTGRSRKPLSSHGDRGFESLSLRTSQNLAWTAGFFYWGTTKHSLKLWITRKTRMSEEGFVMCRFPILGSTKLIPFIDRSEEWEAIQNNRKRLFRWRFPILGSTKLIPVRDRESRSLRNKKSETIEKGQNKNQNIGLSISWILNQNPDKVSKGNLNKLY